MNRHESILANLGVDLDAGIKATREDLAALDGPLTHESLNVNCHGELITLTRQEKGWMREALKKILTERLEVLEIEGRTWPASNTYKKP